MPSTPPKTSNSPKSTRPVQKTSSGRVLAGASDSVAGTPKSWRKRHDPVSPKPVKTITTKKKAQSMPLGCTRPTRFAAPTHEPFDEYQESPEKQLKEEQAEKEALYRKIAYEMYRMEQHEQEQALRRATVDVRPGIDQTLAVMLSQAKAHNTVNGAWCQ